MQRVAIDICSAPNHAEKLAPTGRPPRWHPRGGFRDPTEVGELGGSAVELELVAGEGLEPVLERVLQRPRYDRLHGRPPPAGALRWSFWGGDSWREPWLRR